jgi:hypothetical protein
MAIPPVGDRGKTGNFYRLISLRYLGLLGMAVAEYRAQMGLTFWWSRTVCRARQGAEHGLGEVLRRTSRRRRLPGLALGRIVEGSLSILRAQVLRPGGPQCADDERELSTSGTGG